MTIPTGVDFRKYSDEELTTMLAEAGEASKHARKRGRAMGIVAAHRLKQMKEILLHNELAIWRRENGFDRVEAVEKNRFGDHRSLPPTPEQYYASLWAEVDALKEAIWMPARTPWQKTAEFVDGLKGKLPDWELAEIKRYVEKRCRKEAHAQMTAKPVGTVKHCSPISPNPDTPSGVCFNLEDEGKMGQELKKLESSSADTGLETPCQQGPPNEGSLEQRQTTANGFLTVGVNPSQEGRTPSPPERSTSTRTFADIFSTAAIQENRKLKTFNELNKPFDPGGREKKAPPWNAAVPLPFLSVCLWRIWEAPCPFSLVCSVFFFCFPKLLIYPGETYQQAERRGSWTPIKSLMYATGGQAFSRLLPYLKMARTSNALV